jgi:dipeptidyl-peptidase 8
MRVDPATLSIEPTDVAVRRSTPLSREEELLAERMRTGGGGVHKIEWHAGTHRLLLTGIGTIITLDPATGACAEVPSGVPGPRLHTALSSDGVCFAAVRQRNIHVMSTLTGTETCVTDANGTTVMAGEADFIHQEEFGLYKTYAFAPATKGGLHRIVYLEMDESQVHVYNIANLDKLDGSVDPTRYALTGTANATIKAKLVAFDAAKNVVASRVELHGALPPWTEYVPRCGWLDVDTAYFVVVDRLQQRAALVAVVVDTQQATVLYEEKSDAWINAGDNALMPQHVFGDGSVLIASEHTGFVHLYRLAHGKLTAVTAGQDWKVEVKPRYTEGISYVWVDEPHSVVYFMARREGPLQEHLCVASLRPGADPTQCIRLTEAGLSHTCSVGEGQFLTVGSSLTTPATIASFSLTFPDASTVFPVVTRLAKREPFAPLHDASLLPSAAPPQLFHITSNGLTLHGMTYVPPNRDPNKRYPLVVYTYGGPSVQLVEDEYIYTRGPRSARWQLLASLGFVVSVLDNRGSSGRGIAFQRELQYKMGTVEIEDQVLHVKHLVDSGLVDPKRVAIYGASYGGYMALMALCKRR